MGGKTLTSCEALYRGLVSPLSGRGMNVGSLPFSVRSSEFNDPFAVQRRPSVKRRTPNGELHTLIPAARSRAHPPAKRYTGNAERETPNAPSANCPSNPPLPVAAPDGTKAEDDGWFSDATPNLGRP